MQTIMHHVILLYHVILFYTDRMTLQSVKVKGTNQPLPMDASFLLVCICVLLLCLSLCKVKGTIGNYSKQLLLYL